MKNKNKIEKKERKTKSIIFNSDSVVILQELRLFLVIYLIIVLN